MSADAKNLANASGAFTSCLAHALSSGDCSSSAADVRVRNSLLQFGFDQDAIIQCSTSCVLCGWGFDSSDDVLGLQLEATGVVRAVNSNRVSVSVEKLPGSSDFEATASCDCIGGAKEAASAFWKLDTRAVIGQSSVYSQNYVDDGLHTAVTVARGSSSEGGKRAAAFVAARSLARWPACDSAPQSQVSTEHDAKSTSPIVIMARHGAAAL